MKLTIILPDLNNVLIEIQKIYELVIDLKWNFIINRWQIETQYTLFNTLQDSNPPMKQKILKSGVVGLQIK